MKYKINPIFFILFASCEPNISKEFKFERKDSFELNPTHKSGPNSPVTTHGAVNFEFSTNLTLSYSEDDNLTYFHWVEIINNMSLDDKFFNTKPFCQFIYLYGENGTCLSHLFLEKDGKFFRDEQNNLNCEGICPGKLTFEKLKKIRWYGMRGLYSLHFTNQRSGYSLQEFFATYPPSTKQKN